MMTRRYQTAPQGLRVRLRPKHHLAQNGEHDTKSTRLVCSELTNSRLPSFQGGTCPTHRLVSAANLLNNLG